VLILAAAIDHVGLLAGSAGDPLPIFQAMEKIRGNSCGGFYFQGTDIARRFNQTVNFMTMLVAPEVASRFSVVLDRLSIQFAICPRAALALGGLNWAIFER
jgi:hypothetical protein